MVLIHGLLMNSSEWDGVVSHLRAGHRCITPTLPLGSHRFPMRAHADLSFRGHVSLLAEFLESLHLRQPTIVANDWGGPLLLAADRQDLVSRLVITSCEAFENIPPGLPGMVAGLSGHLPGSVLLMSHLMRVPAMRRLPVTFGWMSKRPVPDALFNSWMVPLRTQPGVRRDVNKYTAQAKRARPILRDATERLATFPGPTLVVWAKEDRVMPPEHGRRLAHLLPHGRLVEIDDSYTLVPIDQPKRLAHLIGDFIAE